MDQLTLKAWKNETINAQLILIKYHAQEQLKNLTITTTNNPEITTTSNFFSFINARENKNNQFLTSFDQHIGDWIKDDTTENYDWKNYQVLPVWITIKPKEAIVKENYQITITIKYNEIVSTHTINLIVLDRQLPDLNNQDHYNLDLWQNWDRTIDYYQNFEDQPIIINDQRYFKYTEPYFLQLNQIGQKCFNFGIDQFLNVKFANNDWTINFQENLDIDSYLKKILNYGFSEINLSTYLLLYEKFKELYNDLNLNDQQILEGFNAYQKFVYDYFKTETWYNDVRPKLYLTFDEVQPKVFQKAISDLNDLQGENKVFALSVNINYDFYTSNKTIESLKKVDKLSISYSHLNFMTKSNYDRVIELVNFREKNNKFTSIYSCTGDYPANFIKSQPGESAFIPLYGLKYNIHNFLRWSYNIWPESWINTTKITEADDQNLKFESGDLYSVYPLTDNQVGLSPRIKLLNYGQEQAIKIAILKTTAPEQINQIIDNITAVYWPDNFKPKWNLFTRKHNPSKSWFEQLNQIVTAINNL